MTTDATSITATRTIPAAAVDVFDLLSNPKRHTETDASGMVISDEKAERIKAVGDTFRMNMNRTDKSGQSIDYQVENHVTGFADGRLIAWKPGIPGEQEPFGWEWVYALEPTGPDATDVSLSYRWTDAPKEVVERFGLPAFSASDLDASLAKLADSLAG